MLSYQHGFHAGNLADVHKHALLAWMLNYLVQKAKPLSYLETHAGRGLYDLSSPDSLKTGEAAAGILRVEKWFDGHPYGETLQRIRTAHGANSYPGSPLIAQDILRPDDQLLLAELHPQEGTALNNAMVGRNVKTVKQDGFEMAISRTPPTPRRGFLLCDPSFEVKQDYQTIPDFLSNVHRRWPVGVLSLWFPILADGRQQPMVDKLQARFAEAVLSVAKFPPARPDHGMVGSGLFVINPPYGLDSEARRIEELFRKNL